MKKLLIMTCAAAITANVTPAIAGAVFDDSEFWFYANRDAGTVGVFETGDFNDVFHVGNISHALNQQPVSGRTQAGNSQTATIATEDVTLPTTGETLPLKVVTFPQAGILTSGGADTNLWPNALFIGTADARLSNTDSYTVVMRIMRTGLPKSADGKCVLADFGFNYGDGRSYKLNVDENGCLFVESRYSGNTWYAWGNQAILPLNKWVDFALVFRGNGWSQDKGRFDGGKATLYLKTVDSSFVQESGSGGFWGDMSMVPWNYGTSYTSNRNLHTLFSKIRMEEASSYKTRYNWGLERALPVKFQQIAIWARRLDEYEIAEAFGVTDDHVLGIGRFDGSSDDLGGGTAVAFTLSGNPDWSAAPSVLPSGGEINYSFSPSRTDKNCAVFIGAAEGSGSGSIRILVNGNQVKTGSLSGDNMMAAVIKARHLREGVNTLTVRRMDSGADIAFDAVKIETPWQIGTRDNNWGEFGHYGEVNGTYDARKNTLSACKSGMAYNAQYSSLQSMSFMVPFTAEQVKNIWNVYRPRMILWGWDGSSPCSVALYVNGSVTPKYEADATTFVGAWKDAEILFEPGELIAGNNLFEWRLTPSAQASGTQTLGFDCHQFDMKMVTGLIITLQ